jgi:TRAP-type C4-dicarboxylate transport system substrate-binding protein
VLETIRFGGYQSAASVHSRAIAVFARALERRLDGEIAIEITLNVADQGRKAADLLSLVERGEIDLCYFSACPSSRSSTFRSRSAAASRRMPPGTGRSASG